MDKGNVMDWEFRHASELARASRLFQLAADAADTGARAWDRSQAVRSARAAVRELSLLAIVDRLRLIGLLVLCATITHAVLLWFVPRSLAPAAPLVVQLLALAAALALIAGPRAIVAAWSVRRRH
jgi:hypothetical protein